MIYFFHHYELPVIMQQARIQQIIIETRQNANRDNNNDLNTNNTASPTNHASSVVTPPINIEEAQNINTSVDAGGGLVTNSVALNEPINSGNVTSQNNGAIDT